MKHIDITFDFETCSTAPDAAPMQLAAVAWDRNATGEHPFFDETFNIGIDLRTCVVEGFSFDQETIDFWSRQNGAAKQSVTEDECWPVDIAFQRFCEWVETTKERHDTETTCLWCQGQDFDFPILKTIARRFGLKMPAHQHYFRDCRTFVLEAALLLTSTGQFPKQADEIMEKPMRAYDMLPTIPADIVKKRTQHDPLYDCLRSTWSVWQMMKMLKAI